MATVRHKHWRTRHFSASLFWMKSWKPFQMRAANRPDCLRIVAAWTFLQKIRSLRRDGEKHCFPPLVSTYNIQTKGHSALIDFGICDAFQMSTCVLPGQSHDSIPIWVVALFCLRSCERCSDVMRLTFFPPSSNYLAWMILQINMKSVSPSS